MNTPVIETFTANVCRFQSRKVSDQLSLWLCKWNVSVHLTCVKRLLNIQWDNRRLEEAGLQSDFPGSKHHNVLKRNNFCIEGMNEVAKNRPYRPDMKI